MAWENAVIALISSQGQHDEILSELQDFGIYRIRKFVAILWDQTNESIFRK